MQQRVLVLQKIYKVSGQLSNLGVKKPLQLSKFGRLFFRDEGDGQTFAAEPPTAAYPVQVALLVARDVKVEVEPN